MNKKLRWGLIFICWLTAVLRTSALFLNDFHADEALFASWARHIAVWRDPLLLTQAVDKPPLLFYLQALFYPLQGPVEWAARLPNYVASILLVPLVGVIVWRLFRRWKTAVFAAALVALSPLHIQFSASAFTDPLLTTFLFTTLALQIWPTTEEKAFSDVNGVQRAASEDAHSSRMGRGDSDTESKSTVLSYSPLFLCSFVLNNKPIFYSGLFFGFALLTKHQAWLFLSLFAMVGLWLGWRRRWLVWGGGVLPLLLAGWGWELVRNGRLTLISLQVDNVGGFRLVAWQELATRLIEGAKIAQFVVHPGWILLGVVFTILLTQRRRGAERNKLTPSPHRPIAPSPPHPLTPSPPHPLTPILLLFITAYILLHWLLDIPVWDRYFLPLVPLVAVLMAGWFEWLNKIYREGRKERKEKDNSFATLVGVAIFLSVVMLALWQGVLATNGRFPIGARPFADSGAALVAESLAEEPYGTVLYDHWYSWHWQYHLFDKKVHLNWFPDEETLLEDLDGFYDDVNRRYITLPTDGRETAVLQALHNANYTLTPVAVEGGSDIILYRIGR